MDRTRRISEMALQRYPDAFSSDYEKNKKVLHDLAVIPSKQLRNHVAGYIAKSVKAAEAEEEEQLEEVKAE